MTNQFIIKPAALQDIPIILQFIKELAEYEKLLHEVVATEESLRQALFGERPYAEVIIAYYQNAPVGFALFFHNFSTLLGKPGIYLEDLYIKPDYRGNGFGRLLLSYLAKLTIERNCGRLEWWVLDWNKSAIRFYESLDAKSMDEWTTYRVSGTALQQLAAEIQSRRPNSNRQ